MKYELSDDDVEFITAAIETHVASAMAIASTEIVRHAEKNPKSDDAEKWLDDLEGMILQERGYVTRRESVFEALRKPIK